MKTGEGKRRNKERKERRKEGRKEERKEEAMEGDATFFVHVEGRRVLCYPYWCCLCFEINILKGRLERGGRCVPCSRLFEHLHKHYGCMSLRACMYMYAGSYVHMCASVFVFLYV